MRRKGFTLAEVVVALAVVSIVGAVSFSLRFADFTEEELVAQEAGNLARWIENAFLRSQATKQMMDLVVVGEICRIDWYPYEPEFYATNGKVRFLNMSSMPLSYSPLLSTNSPFGMTIMVCNRRRNIARFVIISRFARVRVSKTPY